MKKRLSSSPALSLLLLISAMVIFGTIGLFRKSIPLGSATLAAVRGALGVLSVLVIMLILRRRPDFAAIRKNLLWLILSGACIGVNWILLFEAYKHATVAVATLCYYMAPVFAILAAPLVVKEKLTVKKMICVVIAVAGMICISGVFGGGSQASEPLGILLGVGAAVFYASVILMNRKLRDISAYDKTVVQLLSATVVVLPYALIAEKLPAEGLTLPVIGLTATVGILHTGIAYAMYFGSMKDLPTQTVALFGYLDPVVAILLSVFFLEERMGVFEIVGVVCILGAALLGELHPRRNHQGTAGARNDKN